MNTATQSPVEPAAAADQWTSPSGRTEDVPCAG